MKALKRTLILLLAIVMILSLTACGSYRTGARQRADSAAPVSSPVPAPAAGSYNSYYAAEEAEMAYDGDYGFSAVPMAAMDTAETGATAAKGTSGSEVPDENSEKIIYSSDVTVETTQFEETVGKVSAMVKLYGAWIESSSVSGSNYYQTSRGNASMRSASYTLRVPSGRFNELMDNLSDLGNIPYSHIYTENVTSQYYDVQAHLKAYTTQETRLLEMMELAETVEDVIIIEDRLTELRYQIEALQSRLNNWDRRVSYSTVSLTVKEVQEYTPEEKVEPTYWEELAQALKNGLYNAGQFLKDLLVFLIEIIPVLIILVPVVWLVIWLMRKLIGKIRAGRTARKDRKKKKAEQPKTVETEQKAEADQE